ncbi:hypothetical protein C4J87_2360 [Pseudomonas sp. R1-43-08]|uniref:hypothetical protein n=1 Tax=Pseudomonas sp. R1-43-08 TaxID=1173270 RepID=UPI000F6CE436|nr:hypothetical protein [Pseudomonas sp. R1-43-08]AZF42519.1 hypothetical protein C4J87_2360 [Pseudomonas sp. R1-43-08]
MRILIAAVAVAMLAGCMALKMNEARHSGLRKPAKFPANLGRKTMRVFFLLLMMISGYTFAGCDSIGDSDQRAYCKAKEGRGSCGSINDRDLRYACNAETNGGSCNSIDDRDQRYLCNARTNNGSCGSIDDRDLRAQCDALKH